MFIGHFGLGFGAKSITPKISLGVLFIAAQFIDLLWPTLLLIGVERVQIAPGATAVTPLIFEHYPISHSLLAVMGWAVVLAVWFWLIKKSIKGAAVIALLVLSHWGLDLIVHQPDLPLYPGSEIFAGLNAWSSLPLTLLFEITIFSAGVWLYAKATKPSDTTGRWAFWGLVVFLLVVYAGNIFGPPPPSVEAIAWAGQLQWLLVLWAFWVDRHRSAIS